MGNTYKIQFLNSFNEYLNAYDIERFVYSLGKKISKRGYYTKSEFRTVCLWKSRRPKKLYEKNSSTEIKQIFQKALDMKDEKSRIDKISELKGVSIPTASALLSVMAPNEYPIIDIRCIESLKKMDLIKWSTITSNSWVKYLTLMRELALELNVSPRKLDKALFAFNRRYLDENFKNLYTTLNTN